MSLLVLSDRLSSADWWCASNYSNKWYHELDCSGFTDYWSRGWIVRCKDNVRENLHLNKSRSVGWRISWKWPDRIIKGIGSNACCGDGTCNTISIKAVAAAPGTHGDYISLIRRGALAWRFSFTCSYYAAQLSSFFIVW